MKKIFILLSVVAIVLVAVKSGMAEEYDIAILGGRVMDPETEYDKVANVGVKDGRIAIITEGKISGRETLNAEGLVVAPGFIDGHQHCIEPYAYRLMLRDGRTTIMDLEVGAYGPLVDKWYKQREGQASVNFGVAVSHEFARAAVLDGFNGWKYINTPDAIYSRVKQGWSITRPTLEQGNRILANIDEGLQQGGLGIGSTLGYMRAGVSAREVYELQRLGNRYGRFIDMHFRYTPGDDVGEVNGIQEMLANAAALGSSAIAAHFNNAGYNLVHELLVNMRGRGYNVWGEIYPYSAGSTALNAVFLEPEVWVKTLGNKYEETLQDVATGEFYTQKTREEMLEKEPTRAVIVYKCPDEWVVNWIRLPGVAIGSDGMPLFPDDGLTWDTPYENFPNTHPRFAGSFAKVLRIARENDIPLMQAVAMTSYNYAKPLGDTGLRDMRERGRMQMGMIADITIFDPETVTDNSTYAKGTLPSTGILHVIVNGKVAMKDQEPLKGVNAGLPIRFEPVKSRFEPLDENEWMQTFYASPVDFGGGVPGSQPRIH
ncbi:amidohydrolase family protein [Desulfovibrio sp. Fe33]|uniref:amidohydrolase family protein n=1 Tax=Desulfovibrio sp. Fe33 TaxID=3020842 RepID=UPI00234C5E8C|nr:amidohydrolase family protein [Desulfovibrio sp. Fe33]